ncbi:MAG TPA: HD domain-containing phosphohydrolase [Gemmataceae bacterium]|nr:HD domain-containing phosphohydrolase [Gemmataceae bacterium]
MPSPVATVTGTPTVHPEARALSSVLCRHRVLRDLLAASIVLVEDWDSLSNQDRQEIEECTSTSALAEALVRHSLLTKYQADRVEAGKTFGLVLNNYRVLERLGAGAMGVVFKAENVRLRRPVALKVLALGHEGDPRLLLRFFAEIRAIAQMQHPNIAAAMDAGETQVNGPDHPALHYLVMEYVPGQDLEEYVQEHGPLPTPKACDVIHQVASALSEAHRHGLIHRDIKPSNIRLTPEGQAKLLDFGLARRFGHRLTDPGTLLGTIEYIAPEQARDAHEVDIRADLYSLGGTLFWCLTGQSPFPNQGSLAHDFVRRLNQPPPSARAFRPDVPAGLDAIVARLLAVEPDDRFQGPQDVMRALLPFLKPDLHEHLLSHSHANGDQPGVAAAANAPTAASRLRHVLVVDDEAAVRKFCRHALGADDLQLDEAANGAQALEALAAKPFDLVLLDVDLPGLSGADVLARVRAAPPGPHLKVIMFSGRASADAMAQLMMAGADDYLTKPFSIPQLRARIRAALVLKEAQDRSATLNCHLLAVNSELERNLNARDSDLVHARNALVLALAKLVEHRDTETGVHLMRIQSYCRCLAQEAARSPAFGEEINAHFIDMLECCAPLHDIGKVGLPDHILLKPGKLTPDERVLMQMHTVIGADTLQEVAKKHGFALAFLEMAADIARHHHERHDGRGYPDGLSGSDIPLAARLVAIGDVYDALRSRRVYKPALSHTTALRLIVDSSPGQFDPALVQIFLHCAPRFEQIFHDLAD